MDKSSNDPVPGLPELSKRFAALRYHGGNGWLPLPVWAQFFLELGCLLPALRQEKRSAVIVVVVPTRAFVSALISAGLVIARAAASLDLSEHLRLIQSLAPGTPVILHEVDRILKARYQRCITSQNKQYVLLQIEQGTAKGVPVEDIQRIRISERADEINLPKQQKGRSKEPASPMLKAMLNNRAANDFTMETRIECLLVGVRNLLEAEIDQTRIAFETVKHQQAIGSLQDILRVREFMPVNSAHRTALVSHRSPPESSSPSTLPPFIVFDGSASFLKMREFYRNSNWVVILDRSERNLADAAEQINQEYSTRRIEAVLQADLPALPSGTELMVYWTQA